MRRMTFEESEQIMQGCSIIRDTITQQGLAYVDGLRTFVQGEIRERLKRGEVLPEEDVDVLPTSLSMKEHDELMRQRNLVPHADDHKWLAACYVYAAGLEKKAA